MNGRAFLAGAFFATSLALAASASGAERFDDIVVAPQALVSGETFHGYRELRFVLENHSTKKTHAVTLTFPERTYGSGDSIGRMSRTVSLGPSASAAVPLWQPPLAMDGNPAVAITVDDELAGTMGLSGNFAHMRQSGGHYGGTPDFPATILVSRSVNFDDANRILNPNAGGTPFTAAAATGPPDASGGSVSLNVWMPDGSFSPHWLELDYDPPLTATGVKLFQTRRLPPGGEIILIGISGANLARLPFPKTPAAGVGAALDFTGPITTEPVKSVRIEFARAHGSAINIDAVQLTGVSNSAWATAARASSVSTGPAPARMSPATPSRELLRSEVTTAEWSEYWLSYTPYEAIMLTAAELRGAPPAVQTALWRYSECGGTLVLLGGGPIPEPWGSFQKSSLQGGRRFTTGLGQCFVFESDRISDMGTAAAKTVTEAMYVSARYWQLLPDENIANTNFPVVENTRIPVRGTVFVMLAFVVLAGPVNWIVLSRSNRRTWLLWTIPAISLLTCILVFVYSYLREGFTPDARIEGLTLLDQANHRATSTGIEAFYCPLTPSSGLFFGSETEATPLLGMTDFRYLSRRRRSGTPREMDWTQSQHLQRGWVTARVPAHFHVRKSETRRERLQLESSGGELSAINGLGAPIRSLLLADSAGRLYTASNIIEGKKGTLTLLAEFSTLTEQLGPRLFAEKIDFGQSNDRLAGGAAYLLTNTYIAELETNPFLENALAPKGGSARTRSRSIVYGILEPVQP